SVAISYTPLGKRIDRLAEHSMRDPHTTPEPVPPRAAAESDSNHGQTATAVKAIRDGDIDLLRRLLEEHPDLVKKRVDGQRTLLHVATDWPGNFPNNPATVAFLIAQGAPVNAAFIGRHSETPLHWAASSNDVDVIDVLLDHGADIEA